jgi:hypothetical protein
VDEARAVVALGDWARRKEEEEEEEGEKPRRRPPARVTPAPGALVDAAWCEAARRIRGSRAEESIAIVARARWP